MAIDTKVVWFSVTEQLPRYGISVLFVNEADEVFIGSRDYTDSKGEHWNEWDKDGGEREVENVTHWADLPLSPKEIQVAREKGEDS